MRASGRGGEHISGAEGLFAEKDIKRAVSEFTLRALGHPRGRPADISITVERLVRRPRAIAPLPVTTVVCPSPSGARTFSRELLGSLGISDRAVGVALDVIYGRASMRGAALVGAVSGRRLEGDTRRGVRASMMGIDRRTMAALGRRLSRYGINTPMVKEALALATKVAYAPGAVAELCASDDPGYTTGYVASIKTGYVRITNIKKKGSGRGGRVFFVDEGAELERLVGYLEMMPVIVRGTSVVTGPRGPEDVIRNNNR